MKKLMFTFAAMSALMCAAYTQAPVGLKTPWGEKVTPANAWREYPRPQMVRGNWTNLNGLWQYAVTKNAPGCPSVWDGEILVPFVIESSLSGVGRLLEPSEQLWYKRTFTANVKPGERLLLHFEQADFRAMVYVNGRQADIPHEGGQMPFTYDVTDLVKAGENELVVSIWDPTTDFIGSTGKQVFRPGGCMYTRSSGIGGTVWMETVPETYLTDYKVTTDIDAGTVSVTLAGAGNLSEAEATVTVRKDGQQLAVGKMKAWGKPITLKLPQPIALWSPESPALYDLEIVFKDDETDKKDVVRGYFGMRKIEMKKDPNGVLRLYFNNKMRFIIGTLDQGWWPDGLLTPPSDEAMAYDIKALKEMGFDMMRKHIKVEPRRYYYLCDKLGLLVMQDMPSGAGDATKRYGFYRAELKQMIDHLYNSPSIIAWIPYNEGWGQPGEFLSHATLVWTQQYDPTRIVDGPSGAHDFEGGDVWRPFHHTQHKPAGVEEAADLVDRHDYAVTPGMFKVNPRRASFLGEFGGIGCRVEGHLWTAKAWGYGNTGKDADRSFVENKFITLMDHVAMMATRGLTGSVYTQTTDVEAEINGLITYDRKVVKFNPKALAAVHDRVRKAAEVGMTPRTQLPVLKRLDSDPKAWAWTTEAPGAGWEQPAFNDAAWARSAGGFGNKQIMVDHPNAKVTTEWTTKNIWLRRTFTYTAPEKEVLQVVFDLFHDEDTEIYLNGVRLVAVKGYNNDWEPVAVPAAAFLAAVKPGKNTLAVHVRQNDGGQYIDLGIGLDVAK